VITCTRRIQFCAGHRVFGHEGKCRHLHGHNYVVMLTASADALDNLGRVIDFSVLKARLGGWIDQHWDHGCVIWDGDTEAQAAVLACQPAKLFLLPSNPTAENMADYLLRVVGPEVLADTGIGLTAVRLWETENCYADATL
jgi:6-pyruvoyltetrahydropterin/6-carboxytetrahydropterin synthase